MPGGKRLTPAERRQTTSERLKAGTATTAEKYKAGVKTPAERRKSERKFVELHAFSRAEKARRDKESKQLMKRAIERKRKQQEKKPGFFEQMLGGATKKYDELLGALGRKK